MHYRKTIFSNFFGDFLSLTLELMQATLIFFAVDADTGNIFH